MEKSKRERQQDLFIPDEIIIMILSKLGETHFKYLCQNASLVSKRFSSLLYNIPSLSVSLPLDFPRSPNFNDFLLTLHKFVQLRSIHIEFVTESDFCRYTNSDPDFAEWKAVCTPKCHTFVFLSSYSFSDLERYNGCPELIEITPPTEYSMGLLGLLEEACSWFEVTWMVLVANPMLRSVKITDSNKQGKLWFTDDGDKLSKPRNLCVYDVLKFGKIEELRLPKSVNNPLPRVVRYGELPELRLPVADMAMNLVNVGLVRVGGKGTCADDDVDGYDEIVNWDFEEDEKLFAEAVTKLFKNKNNKLPLYAGE